MPATCHSFKSRYSLIASAARKDRLRPVLLANFSNRFLMIGSIRTLTVVEDMSCLCRLCLIVYMLAQVRIRQHEGPASQGLVANISIPPPPLLPRKRFDG